MLENCNFLSAYVEAYLEKTFYNLTTLALHNWRTYGEMRALAKHKFQTETGDDLLPPQTLEQVKFTIIENIHKWRNPSGGGGGGTSIIIFLLQNI